MQKEIADIRTDYRLQVLNESDVAVSPFLQFGKWWEEAIHSQIHEVNAMALATVSKDGIPSVRIVLLKGFTEKGFQFFTNYESHKGRDLAENPNAAVVIFWKELERQVRIEGMVEKLPEEESLEYFNSRPAGSRLGAWASRQSSVIESRSVLEENMTKYVNEFKEGIPKPPFWGGYILIANKVEFWQGRSNRLHDRLEYIREGEQWKIVRLAP